jgi:hypothetical protein
MIHGRVDEMRNGKVYGWAFDSDNPDHHLEIRITRGSDVIALGLADRMRADLPDAGVGKGDHAFEIVVPPNITSFVGLVILAKSEKSGQAPLAIATNDERRLDDLFEIFARKYDDALFALKADIDDVRATKATGAAEKFAPEDVPEASLASIDERLSNAEKHIADLEVFVMRIDESLRKLQQRVGILRPPGLFARIFRRGA